MNKSHRTSEQNLNDSHVMWNLIQVGDLVSLEADLIVNQTLQLQRDHYYLVISKAEAGAVRPVFYVESDLTGELVEVYPGFISDYKPAMAPTSHN